MDTSQVPAGSIVVGIDGSSWSDGALDWAIDQAAIEQRDLTIVHAIPAMGAQSMGLYPSSGLDFVRVLDDARADAQALLDRAVAHAHDRASDLHVHDVLSVSDPRSVLLELGEHAAMLVVGSRGRGPVVSLLLGSVSVSVSKHASCPVVVRRSSESTRPDHRIVVGVDGTEPSLPAIEFAYRMASFRASALTVLHCYWTASPVAPSPGGVSCQT
jgi:nucleotide-binding universal stress UspA family protein